MNTRQSYEHEVFESILAPFRKTGMADDQLTREIAMQQRIKAAIAELDAAIEQINTDSECATINAVAWDNFIADEMPSFTSWDEAISGVRRGY